MKTGKTFWIFLIILIVSIYGVIFTDAQIFYRVVYLSAILLIFSFIWTIFSIKGIEVNRFARLPRQRVGEVLIEQFIVHNHLPIIRIWLEIQDECKIKGKTGSKVLSWIGSRQKRTYVTHSRLLNRGEYPLGPTKISSGDPLGLFINTRTIKPVQIITVLPYVVRLKSFPAPSGLLAGGRVIGRRTYEATPQVYGIREYSPGDPLNRIHWLSTLRKDKLMVKEFEQDPRADVWIFLDAARNIHERKSEDKHQTVAISIWMQQKTSRFNMSSDSFEYAITIAGSIAGYFIRLGRAVGLVCSGQTKIIMTPERGERQHSHILETLAFIKDEGDLPILTMVNYQAENIPRGSTVTVITTTKCPQLEHIAYDLTMRRLNPIFVLLDDTSFSANKAELGNGSNLQLQRIPFVIVKNQDDIGLKLEKGFNLPISINAIDR